MRRKLASAVLLGIAGCSFLVDTEDLTGIRRDGGAQLANEDGATEADTRGDGASAADGTASDDDATPVTVDAPFDALSDSTDVASGSPYAAAVKADHPLMYLRFGDPAASTAPKDEMGNVQVSTIGAPTWGRPGAIAGDADTAVLVTSSGFDCGPGFDFVDQQPFTIELWARTPDVGVGATRFLLRKGDFLSDGALPSESYSLYYNHPSVVTNVIFSRRRGGVSETTDFPFSLASTSFRHIVAKYESDRLLLWVDGKLVGSDVASGLAANKTGNLYVGLRDATSGFVDTEIDELAIYDYALADSRIELHCASGRGPPINERP